VNLVELVEVDGVTGQQWTELVAGEHEPWGGVAEHLEWAKKNRHVAIVDADRRSVALASAATYDVEVASSRRFQVVGIGGVFVTSAHRGTGLATVLIRGVLDMAAQMGPDRMMLFCRPQLTDLYRKFGFREIRGPVWAEQPAGRIEMPLRAMWRPLTPDAQWPAGRVDVLGLPF
jgi:aminoglycoside 2'-N-acetyltransferase I